MKKLLLSLLFVSTVTFAQPPEKPTKEDDTVQLGHSFYVTQEIYDMCKTKGIIMEAVYQHRAKTDKNKMIEVVENNWGQYTTVTLPRAMRVDTIRIINDAYRQNADGTFRRQIKDNEALAAAITVELSNCLTLGF